MVKYFFQFKADCLAIFKENPRTALVESIPYDSIVSVANISPVSIVIKGKSAWLLLFRDLANYSIDWQKSLLILKDKDSDEKEEVKELELTYFFEPIKLRFWRSNYSFNFKKK